MKLRGPFLPSRQLAIGKTIYVREGRGQLVVCKWPRKRPRVTHPTTLAQMEKFRQAAWLTKYTAAPIQMAHREMVKGTSLLPRDLMIAAMYGRGFTWQIEGSRRRYPVAALRDLSDTLDIFGSLPSDILARGPDRWYAVTPAQAGQSLVSGAPGQLPTWQTLAGGSGVWQQIEDVTLPADLALNVLKNITIPANTWELDFYIAMVGSASTTDLSIRFNSDVAANYNYTNHSVNGSAATVAARAAAQTRIRPVHNTLTPTTARSFTSGRIQQKAAGQPVSITLDCIQDTVTSTKTMGFWNPPAGIKLSQLGFTSVNGVGLRAGTRIIVRAAIP